MIIRIYLHFRMMLFIFCHLTDVLKLQIMDKNDIRLYFLKQRIKPFKNPNLFIDLIRNPESKRKSYNMNAIRIDIVTFRLAKSPFSFMEAMVRGNQRNIMSISCLIFNNYIFLIIESFGIPHGQTNMNNLHKAV